jgi:hypothetical protein
MARSFMISARRRFRSPSESSIVSPLVLFALRRRPIQPTVAKKFTAWFGWLFTGIGQFGAQKCHGVHARTAKRRQAWRVLALDGATGPDRAGRSPHAKVDQRNNAIHDTALGRVKKEKK